MAARIRNFTKFVNRSALMWLKKPLHGPRTHVNVKYVGYAFAATAVMGGTAYWCRKLVVSPVLAKSKEDRQEERREMLRVAREMRFLSFASIEYEGNVFMSPQDFLESVTQDLPRPRKHRVRPSKTDVIAYMKKTPAKKHISTTMFTEIGKEGLISYTEYLFLLCVITKPFSGFRIAFNMFDTDGNEQVDKKEFLVLEQVLLGGGVSSGNKAQLLGDERLVEVVHETLGLKAIRATDRIESGSNLWSILEGSLQEEVADRERSEAQRKKGDLPDTTLTVLFFGKDGKNTLIYEEFEKFMKSLQIEVLSLEFREFSRGTNSIRQEDFARILLRYTVLDDSEKKTYIERLQHRNLSNKGITFDVFRDFCQFLNSLDDFAMAMKIYKMLGRTVDKADFARVVKAVSGHSLDEHLVTVVFDLFDADGDGHLSHKEFLSVMKDRLHRGFRSQKLDQGHFEHYRACIKNEMRA